MKGFIKEGDYYLYEKDGSKMVLVPAGEFLMGRRDSDIFAKEHEKPQRSVYLSAYMIDIFPVTNSQYERFIAAGGYEKREYWSDEGWLWRTKENTTAPLAWNEDGWDAPNQPVAGVSWHEASAYARYVGKRLPTEAEWEKAARGTDGREYPWGDSFPTSKVANFNNNIGATTDVGSYPDGVSPFGCFDMAGNVNNWCLDWYWPEFYSFCVKEGINENPVLDDAMRERIGFDLELKVDKGGGYATASICMEVLSCTDKVFWRPFDRNYWNGFRTVVEAS